MICHIFNFSRFVSLPSKLRFLFLAIIITSLITFIGCGGGAGDEGEECEEGSTSEECTGEEEPPAGSSTLTCVNDEDCDGYSDTCDADSATAYDSTTGETPFSTSCDADQDGHLDADCEDNSLTAGDENCDNCVGVSNADQTDSDGDGSGCDEVVTTECDSLGGDSDYDGVCDDADNCVSVCTGTEDWSCSNANPYTEDTDSDSVADAQPDTDGDGIGDTCDGSDDTDADADGHTVAAGDCDDNNADVYPGSTAEDTQGDGIDVNCDETDLPDETTILWVYTGFSEAQKDEDDVAFDGTSFNRPLHSIKAAFDKAKEDSAIEYIFVYAYSGYTMHSDDVGLVFDEPITVIGGFKCFAEDDTVLDLLVEDDLAACADISQVEREVVDDPEELSVSDLSPLRAGDGEYALSITNSEVTLEGFYLEASDEGDPLSALHIEDSSPTIKNNYIYAPNTDKFAEILIAAVTIYGANSTTSPTLTGNYIVVGGFNTETGVVPDYNIGIIIYTESEDLVLAPTLTDNVINVNQANVSSDAVKIWRQNGYTSTGSTLPMTREMYSGGAVSTNSSKTKKPTLTNNTIETDTSCTGEVYGIHAINSPLTANRNRVLVSSNDDFSYGISIEVDDDAYSTALANTVSIYNNIIEAAWGVNLSSMDKANVINNTIFVHEPEVYFSSNKSEDSGFAIVLNKANNTKIYNNILGLDNSGDVYGILLIYSSESNKLTATLRNNLFHENLSAYIYYSTTSNGPVADLSNLTTKFSTSSTIDANIESSSLSLANSTYEPDEGSPVVDAGYANTINIGDADNNGDAREVNAYDIGAQEYQQ